MFSLLPVCESVLPFKNVKGDRLVPFVKPFEGCVCLVSLSVWYVCDSMLSPQQCLATWDFKS